MATSKRRIPVPGSDREPVPGARIVGAADPGEQALVTVLIRRKKPAQELTAMAQQIGARAPGKRQHMNHDQFAIAYGADPDDLEKVEAFAHEHGLDVAEAKPSERRVVLSGSVANLCEAFGVYLARYEHPNGTYRGRTGSVHVPEDLSDIIVGVFGLDDRPQARAHFRLSSAEAKGLQPHAAGRAFAPPDLATLYAFPTGATGKGQCIAIIELGGGYRTADLKAYFAQLGIPKPVVKSRSVDRGHNHPTGEAGGPDGEVALDIEVAGGVAPGAKIVVYFSPNTDAGFLDAISTAIHDRTNKPSVISISWGGPEVSWSEQAMQAMDQVFQDAAALGVTVCCAAGDDGSSDLRPPQRDDRLLHVDFPASSPFALACGGTRLDIPSAGTTRESVWNEGRQGGATGGGVSDVFALPDWQSNVGVPPSANPGGRIGRGVPDVAADADPQTGYVVLVDGQQLTFGGTSAVAPLYAGLVALLNEKLGQPVGYLNPILYASAAGAFRDVTNGDNDVSGNHGAYKAKAGWDPCTGLGSPDGGKLLERLSGG